MWKGETDEVPSGSLNPEGSIAGPGHKQARDSNEWTVIGDVTLFHEKNENPMEVVCTGMTMMPVLSGNMYAVLADEETGLQMTGLTGSD